jgi:hypothetical protein
MASTLVDLVKINITSTGTGPLTLGSAVPGYRGRSALLDGKTYSYSIQQGANYEVGRGTFLASTNQLVRTVLFSSASGSPVNLTANAQIAFTALAEDLDLAVMASDLSEAVSQAQLAASSAESFAAAAGDAAAEAASTSVQDFVFPDEFDAAAGTGPTHDDLPAFQAMFASALATNRIASGRPWTRYYLSDAIEIDPSRHSFEGNGCILDFRNKSFSDPAAATEKLSDPSFDTGSPWVASPFNTLTPTYDGRLNFLFADGTYQYLEVGQQIACAAGDTLQITLVVDEIRTTTYGPNTYRSLLLSLRMDNGAGAASSIGTGGLSGSVGSFSNADAAYVGTGSTVTFLATPSTANPYLRIQSNAQVRIASCSVKVLPKNECVRVRTPSTGQLRGHNYRNFRNFKIAGRADQAAFVDGILFDTQVSSFSSRVNFYNVDVSDSIGRGLVMGNRAYLMNFYSCRIVASKACVDTLQNSADAGENIAFFGGNLGGGEIGIRNTAGFAIRLFGTSIDFSRQWIVGGNVRMFGGWLETNSPTVAGYPLIDVTTGDVVLRETRVQVDGSTSTALDYPFSVASGCLLDIEAEVPYNLHGNQNALCTGAGRFRFKGVGGANKEMEGIAKRDADHNILGAGGGFEDAALAPLMWASSTASGNAQINRQLIGWPTTVTTLTATFSRGGYAMTVTSATGLAVGNTVTGPGIQSGATILQISGTTITLSRRFIADGTGVTVLALGNGCYATAGMELSTAVKRSGTQSLRLFKTGIGSANLVCTLAVPVIAGRAFGAEWYYKVTGGGSGTTAVYFQTKFARVSLPDAGLPIVSADTDFISDLPQTGIDLAAGRDWTRLSSATNRVDASSGHTGYAPDWATHMLIEVNLSSVPSGFEMFIDDLYGAAM